MTTANSRRLIALAVASATALAACGGSDDATESTSASSSDGTEASTPTSDMMTDETEPTDDSTAGTGTSAPDTTGTGTPASAGDYDLSSVCPSPLVIQTDWFPEAEHGSLYQMIGDDYTHDADNQVTTGPLVAGPDLVDTGVDLEVRAGGPAIGFAPPRAQIYTDDSIHIAYANTDAQVQSWDNAPLVAIAAPLEINPQIIMWDAETWPDVETIEDVGREGMTINLFVEEGFADYFVATEVWDKDQVDPSYDGSPARFIAERNIAQQGFASSEPWQYKNVFEEYGKAPKYQLIHDAGWEIYSQFLGVRPDKLDELSPCLEKFVPIVQQAIVDFANSPDRALDMIVDIVADTDAFWVYPREQGDFGVATMNELGLHGNGPDSTVGNIDMERWQNIIDAMREAEMKVPDDLTAEDMVTNQFIDESIGF